MDKKSNSTPAVSTASEIERLLGVMEDVRNTLEVIVGLADAATSFETRSTSPAYATALCIAEKASDCIEVLGEVLGGRNG